MTRFLSGRLLMFRDSALNHPDALYALLVVVVKFPAFFLLSLSDDPNISSSRTWLYWHAACAPVPGLEGIEMFETRFEGMTELPNKFESRNQR